jgi:hypothetical protein
MLPVMRSMFKSFDTGPYPVKYEGAMLGRGPTEWIIANRMSARRREEVTDFISWHSPHRPPSNQHPLAVDTLHTHHLLLLLLLLITYFLITPYPITHHRNLTLAGSLVMSGENELRCNNLKCRRYVAADGKAVVTTCSRESPFSAHDFRVAGE